MALRISLRSKLAFVSASLLILPWIGYRYVQEMERFLLGSQQQSLLATARAVATMLHERPRLMKLSAPLRMHEAPAPEAANEHGEPAAPVETAQPMPVEIGRVPGIDGRAADGHDDGADVRALLKGVERSGARIWVVNRELKVLAVAGSLKPPAATEPVSLARRLLARLLSSPAQDFDEAFDPDVLTSGPDITQALLGAPAARVRNTRDSRALILSAAHPVWAGDNVVGVVVAEESTHPILSVRNEALEQLLFASLLTLAIVVLVVLGFATRLSSRIRRLRDEAEGALDARGRIARLATASKAGDEIGDLSRSFSAMLARLAQHHGYLESLASRLSHELRTPIAVVRSSLENLRMAEVPADARVYLERAEDGITRLNRILARMTEATRLEASLASHDREAFDLGRVVRECVAGYRLAYPERSFEVATPDTPAMVSGAPDLAAQLLDKLVANAADFCAAGTPIRVRLEADAGQAHLVVANLGPALPEAVADKLFGSMISARSGPAAGGEPHLGLGLYVARLIAEFHCGGIAADNLPDGRGVAVTVTLPLSRA